MHSILDATLVIQMLHFVAAYWILSRIFLKPAYKLVMKIDQERAAYKSAAFQLQQELTTQQQKKTAELTAVQKTLTGVAWLAKTRLIDTVVLENSSQQLALSEASKKEIIKELSEHIKKRMMHE